MVGKWSRTHLLWGWEGGSGSHVGVLEANSSQTLERFSAWGEGKSPADLLPHLSAQVPPNLGANILPLPMRLGETLRGL